MGNGVKWSVDGNSMTTDTPKDINMSVSTGSAANPIPDDIVAEIVDKATDNSYTMNLTLAHDGEFGFTAVMNIELEKKNAGRYANLFYFNKTKNKMEFMCADRIADDGTANLAFLHASDYVIVIDEESLEPETEPSDDTTTEQTSEETPSEQPTTEAVTTTETSTTTAEPTKMPTTETTVASTVITPSTASPTTEAVAESPKTGDATKAPTAVLWMLLSEIGAVACVIFRRKRK
jgi:hypothetical protein